MGRRAHMLGWLAGALVAAVAAGLLVGLLVGAAYLGTGDQPDGWRDLAAFAMGLVIGLGVLALTWAVLLWVVVRRWVRAGRRASVALWTAVGAVVVPVVTFALLSVIPGADGANAGPIAFLAFLAALVVVPSALLLVREGGPQPI